MRDRPRLAIAPPQTGDQEGTWAYYTLSHRFASTARRVIEENRYSAAIVQRLESLIAEIPDAPIRLILDPGAPDLDLWQSYLSPYLGLNWRQPPWFALEHYFYRRILEAIGYFQPGEGSGLDPYLHQKQQGLVVSANALRQLLGKIRDWQESALDPEEILAALLFVNLWGNQADLSLWPADGESKPDHADPESASAHVLVDDSAAVVGLLCRDGLERVDFLVDNAGFELVTDLVFADMLLSRGLAAAVHLHLKPHPTYVSDATIADVWRTVAFLEEESHRECRMLGDRLRASIAANRLRLQDHWFWTSPLDGWLMPGALKRDLAQAGMVISKGDAHYRRLLGDRHWPFDAAFVDILAYYPAPVAALRTLKSELIAGLPLEKKRELDFSDPDWLINGRWGVVQFAGRGVKG